MGAERRVLVSASALRAGPLSLGPDAAKQKFFIAQCYEKLGQTETARDFYGQVASDHPESGFAGKAGKRASALQP